MIQITYTQKIVAGPLKGRSAGSRLTFESREQAAQHVRQVRRNYPRLKWRMVRMKVAEVKSRGGAAA